MQNIKPSVITVSQAEEDRRKTENYKGIMSKHSTSFMHEADPLVK